MCSGYCTTVHTRVQEGSTQPDAREVEAHLVVRRWYRLRLIECLVGGRRVCLARSAQGLWCNLPDLVRRSRDLDRPFAVLEVGELLVLAEEVLEGTDLIPTICNSVPVEHGNTWMEVDVIEQTVGHDTNLGSQVVVLVLR